jgi:hypothetical protein
MAMKSRLIIISFLLLTGLVNNIHAQQQKTSGPSEKLLAENAKLKEKVAAMKKDGVIVEACIACSNMYGVTNELKVCEVDVKGMGVPLTGYLKRGYKIISY